MDDERLGRRQYLRAVAGAGGLLAVSGCLQLRETGEEGTTTGTPRSTPPGTPTAEPSSPTETPLESEETPADTETPPEETPDEPDRSGPSEEATQNPDIPGPARWTQRTLAPIRQPPAVSNGLVLVSSTDRHLYAFDAEDGYREWRVGFSTEPLFSVADGTVVVFVERRVHAMDATTGGTLWDGSSGAGSHMPLVADGTVFLPARVSSGGRVVARSLSSGTKQWEFNEAGTDERTIVVSQPAYADGTVCVAAGKGNRRPSTHSSVYGLDAASGEKLWQTDLDANFGETNLVAAGGYAVGGGDEGALRAFDLETGEQAWTRSDLVDDSLAAHDGTVYLGGSKVVALDPATGQTDWTFDDDGAGYNRFFETPVFDGDSLFAVSARVAPRIYELDPTSGRERNTVETVEADGLGGVAVDEDSVYFGADDANVYAYAQSSSGSR